jgi:hypothetical protein
MLVVDYCVVIQMRWAMLHVPMIARMLSDSE